MKTKRLVLGLTALLIGFAGWFGFYHPFSPRTEASRPTHNDQRLKEFKRLCEYYLREEFGLSQKDPFPQLDDGNTVQLSSGYDAHFSLSIPSPSGQPYLQAVACEMNEWADRFLITTYYN